MACAHKFKEYLNLKRLDFEPTTLIVGTFNPAWPETNYAAWFYGRTSNNYFWEVLPRIHGKPSLINATSTEWKAFCKDEKIAITDLIASIDDAEIDDKDDVKKLASYSDKTIAKGFKKHSTVDVEKLLVDYPSIKNIYLTRGTGDPFWKNLWKPIEKYALEKGLHERKLLTPSSYAFYQQAKYNKQNHSNPLSLEDFILRDWKSKWHDIN